MVLYTSMLTIRKSTVQLKALNKATLFATLTNSFSFLFSFLKRNLKKITIVFFSSCACVKYHAGLLNYIDLPVLDLHGKQKQQKRTNTIFEFCNAKQGTLICTDVAARGLDVNLYFIYSSLYQILTRSQIPDVRLGRSFNTSLLKIPAIISIASDEQQEASTAAAAPPHVPPILRSRFPCTTPKSPRPCS